MLMFKKAVSGILLMIMVSGIALSTSARGKDSIYNPNTYSTEQFLANITRPEVKSETTYKQIYLVCGSSENRTLKFEALVLNDETGDYRPLSIVDGGNSWFMYEPGVFAEQLNLPKTGANKIRIATYYDGSKELIPGKNLQISDYTITFMEKNEVSSMNGFQRIATMLGYLFR